ncbi:DEAD/DEAH box helicase [Nocardioides sp. OK12]|uniref:DEAD/DEAH box helicase n=1 Tax=Nocardioides sp. OK12 TaxID=2758661 RepID=UPI0021C36888|nr:DEAD/DEAH box helicase [Nocardioides sp. OK12]
MPTPDPVAAFAPWLSAEGLASVYDPAAVGRARSYARDGSVLRLEVDVVDGEFLTVDGEVAGTGPAAYRTSVSLDLGRGRPAVTSSCSCPVGWECKHGAALLLRLGRTLTPQDADPATGPDDGAADWADALDTALRDLEASRGDEAGHDALALLLDLHLPRHRGFTGLVAPVVRMRPVRRGASGRWVRGGAAWKDFSPHGVHLGRTQHDPAHVAAVGRLRGEMGMAAYWNVADLPPLADFGPQLWQRLRQARDAGMALVPGDGLGEVRLLDEPVEVVADVTRDGEEPGAASLRFGVRYAEQWWPADRLLLVGDEAHGVVLLDRAPSATTRDATALLAPLAAPVPPALARLVTGGDTTVPPEHLDALVGARLPRLARHLPVVSSDDSISVPAPPTPRLVLVVEWDRRPAAELRWQWRYRVGDADLTCAAGSTARLDGVRDRAAERAELARLTSAGVLAGPGAPPDRGVPTSGVLDLADELARLREAGVEVEEVERPDFRPATGPVEISFGQVGPDDPGDPDDPAAEGDAAAADGATDWLDLSVDVSVDGEQIPLASVLEALTLGDERIVLPSGLHVDATAAELESLRGLVAAAAEVREPTRDDRVGVGGHDLGLWATVGDLAETDTLPAHAQEWVRRAHALRDLTDLPRPEPVGVVSTLRHYQHDGFRWLAFLQDHGLGGVLADDMGLGKTLQVLAAVARARAGGAAPFLVVAPASVVANWARESERHTPGLVVRTITASARKLGTSVAALADGADVVVTTYTLLRLDVEEYAALGWGGLVLDEAQHVKNHLAKTHQAVRRVEAPFRLAVTGTPFENRLMELWSLLALVAPGLYPTVKGFVDHVVRPVEKEGDSAALKRFQQRLRPFLLRRTKDLVAADLPPKQEQLLQVDLGARHRKIYDTHLAREQQKILGLVDDFDRNRVAILSALTRLRQLSLDPALVDAEHDAVGSAKTDVLVEHLLELAAEGHRALVFSQFTGFLRRVRARLDAEGVSYSYLDGRTRKRAEAVEGFRDGESTAFLISLKAGGVGLTLTEADYVFVLDPWWNPAVEAQAVDRAHRIGQTRPVMVYRLVSRDTVEEKVVALKERKAELFAQVVDGDGALGGVIDAADVRALFE